MPNTLLTHQAITREAVMMPKNSNMILRNVDTQYDPEFGKAGGKVGDSLRLRKPLEYIVTDQATFQGQDTNEKSISLVMSKRAVVGISFSSQDKLLSLDDYSDRVLNPAMNSLAGDIAKNIMNVFRTGAPTGVSSSTGGVSNIVYQGSSGINSGGAISPLTKEAILYAEATMSENSCRDNDGKRAVLDPMTNANLVGNLAGLFNSSSRISKQYETGQMKEALGFDMFRDQTVSKHTVGSFTSSNVNGSSQSGSSISVSPITGTLNVGDIITFQGVFNVNPITKDTTGRLKTFVVVLPVSSGATSINIYPAIIPPTANGDRVQYQNVTSAPINNASVALAVPANSSFRRNIAFVPKAVTMVTGDLPLMEGLGVKGARSVYDNISLRIMDQYDITTDQQKTRMECLYGALLVYPEWCCILADAI